MEWAEEGFVEWMVDWVAAVWSFAVGYSMVQSLNMIYTVFYSIFEDRIRASMVGIVYEAQVLDVEKM